MAIDYIIDYNCIPKQTLTTEGLLERLKAGERAQTIIRFFREHGDNRPPKEMGFEMIRRTADGTEETQLIIVQHLLDAAAELDPLAHHCAGCPANRSGRPFGCAGFIQYPITARAEAWLLSHLPGPDEPLVWLLLKQGLEDFQYDGQSVRELRESSDTYFEDKYAPGRNLGEFVITSNQLFEMLFAVGPIQPGHAGVLLLFLHAIPRDMEAGQIITLSPAPADAAERFPLRHVPAPEDETPEAAAADPARDRSIDDFMRFIQALYIAWRLDVALLVDA